MRGAMVLVNGMAGKLHDPMISVLDTGFLHGDTIFTTMAVYAGRIVFWKEHIERLKITARVFGYPSFPEPGLLEEECRKVLSIQPVMPSVLRLTLSRGWTESAGIDGTPGEMTRVFLPVFREPRPESQYEDGVSVECFPIPWDPATDHRFRYKTGNLLWVKMVRSEKKDPDSTEILLINAKKEILEGTVSSVFAIDASGRLRTSPLTSGILSGIMRAKILEWAREYGPDVSERPLLLEELNACREVFLTSSTLPVLPVRTVLSPSGPVHLTGPFGTVRAFLSHYRRMLSSGIW